MLRPWELDLFQADRTKELLLVRHGTQVPIEEPAALGVAHGHGLPILLPTVLKLDVQVSHCKVRRDSESLAPLLCLSIPKTQASPLGSSHLSASIQEGHGHSYPSCNTGRHQHILGVFPRKAALKQTVQSPSILSQFNHHSLTARIPPTKVLGPSPPILY